MPAGRPTTYTEEIAAQIIEVIGRCSCSRTAAAETAGVDEGTVRSWELAIPAFSRAMKRARGSRKARAAERLNEAAENGDTAAIIFTAKCLDPEQYTERRIERVEHSFGPTAKRLIVEVDDESGDDVNG